MPKLNQRGFSPIIIILIVVVVVIAFIVIGTSGFLAGKGTSTFNDTQIQARNDKRKGDIDAIAKALEGYYGQDKQNEYPILKPEWFTSKSVPTDVDGSSYSGVPTSPVTSYHICATLEGSSPQYCVDSQHK